MRQRWEVGLVGSTQAMLNCANTIHSSTKGGRHASLISHVQSR